MEAHDEDCDCFACKLRSLSFHTGADKPRRIGPNLTTGPGVPADWMGGNQP